MELKDRAGDSRPPPFASHSSSSVSFSSGHAWRESDAAVDPDLYRDGFLREIEEQRIREGIIATEVARQMMLEDEVRRELMVERQMGLRHARDGLPYEGKLPMWFGLARKNSLSPSRNVVDKLLFNLHGSSEIPPTEIKPDYCKDKHIMLVGPRDEMLRVQKESWVRAESNRDDRDWGVRSVQLITTGEEGYRVNITESRGSSVRSDLRQREGNQVTCQDPLSSQFERAQVSLAQGGGDSRSEGWQVIRYSQDQLLQLREAVEPHDEILSVKEESLGRAESNGRDSRFEGRPRIRYARDQLLQLRESKQDLNLSGAKEKSSLISATDVGNGEYREVCQKKRPEEWTCALCEIRTTSEGGLNEHLRGKKHKAREASLAQNSKGGNDPLLVHQEQTDSENGNGPKTMKKMEKTKASRMNSKFWCEMCQVGAPSKVAMDSHKKGKKHTAHFKFWCAMCQIGTLSETVMASHMNGKKHRARLIELGQQFGEAGLNFVPGPLIAPSVDYSTYWGCTF